MPLRTKILLTAFAAILAVYSLIFFRNEKEAEPTAQVPFEAADISIFFVGNSHTQMYGIPTLVSQMIEFTNPDKKVLVRQAGVVFLEDVARDSSIRNEVTLHPWDFVVLQAQKISMSGNFEYSKQEGIDFAKLAKANGSTVYFFAEWGRQGVAGDGETIHKIYESMAASAESSTIPIGRAWDIALTEQPDLQLHAQDGNHESPLGAYLTAAVIFGQITGESPLALVEFNYKLTTIDQNLRKKLLSAAAKALGHSQ